MQTLQWLIFSHPYEVNPIIISMSQTRKLRGRDTATRSHSEKVAERGLGLSLSDAEVYAFNPCPPFSLEC